MKTNDVIIRVLNLPERFYSPKNDQSIYSLLKETGYFEIYNSIDESMLKGALEQQPHYLDQWLVWSESKRGASGWYFIKSDNQKYVVGFLDPDKGATEKMEYSNRKGACAFFIKREIESIRKG